MIEAPAELSFLNCYICFESLKKPKICPSCNKVACEKCLRSWVQEKRSECPHCRKMMPLSSFAQCERFMSDIKHLVKALDHNERNKQKCPQHRIQMTYYCEQCEQAICSDCGMFGIKHKGHKITHLKKIYQVYKNKILNQLTQYDQKIESYRQNGHYIRGEQQKLIVQIQQRKNFIQEYFVAIIERLEEEFKEKQDKIAIKYDSNAKEIEFLESFRENIYRELESSSENQLISKCDELVGYIQSVFDKGPEYEPEEYTFDTMSQIVPKYNEFKYALKEYESLDQSIIYSDPYHNNGIEWRLKIYPRGNGQARDNFLSVFLEMSKGYVNGNKYQYKIELLNQKCLKDSVIRQYSSNFDIGECWGYNQFISIDQLKEQFLTDQGNLVFKINVRNPSYRSLVRDQQQYIQSLQEKIITFNKSQVASSQKVASKKSINFDGASPRTFQSSQKYPKTVKQKIKKLIDAKASINLVSHPDQEEQQNSQRSFDIDDYLPQMLKIISNDQTQKHRKSYKSKQKIQMKQEVVNEKQMDDLSEMELIEQMERKTKEQKQKPKYIREYQMKFGKDGKSEKVRENRQNKKKQVESVGSLSMFDPRLNENLLDSREQFSRQNSSLSASIDLGSSASKYQHHLNQ